MKYFLQKVLNKKNSLIIMVVLFFVIPSFVKAASIYVFPSDKEVRVGETFSVSINSNSQGAPINAGSLDIKYDPSFLAIQSITRSSSIFTLWAEEPSYSNSNGLAHFSGGLSSPGWNGVGGNLVTITFKAKAIGQAKITPQNASILANDGIGTNVLNGVTGSSVRIIEAAASTPTPEKVKPKEDTKKDVEEDEPEEVEVEEAVSFEIPLLENVPDQLKEGDTLSFTGRGLLDGEVQVYIQKGKNDIEITQFHTLENGIFSIIYKNPVSTGYYKIWARTVSEDGVLSTPSDDFYVEVIKKTSMNIFGFEITYKSLVNILSFISFLLLMALILRSGLYKHLRNITKELS